MNVRFCFPLLTALMVLSCASHAQVYHDIAPALGLIASGSSAWGEGCTFIDFDENMVHGFLFEGSHLQLSKSQSLYGENYTIWENTDSFNGKWDPVTLF